MQPDIRTVNMGNVHSKLAWRSARTYDVSTENRHEQRTLMKTHSSTARDSTAANAPGPAPAGLWQSMFRAWIDTYALSARSGAVPFLLL
ncbi:MAG: hypothetical protein ABWY05_13260 [Noviherbaspirillum sp.]